MKYTVQGYLKIPISVEVEAESAEDAFNEVQLKLNELNAIYNVNLNVHNLPNLTIHDVSVIWQLLLDEDEEIIFGFTERLK